MRLCSRLEYPFDETQKNQTPNHESRFYTGLCTISQYTTIKPPKARIFSTGQISSNR